MKRWIYTFLIVLSLGLAVGCGSKGGGSGSTPATPTDPGTDTPATPSKCEDIKCTTFQKFASGWLEFSNFNHYKSLRSKYIGCDSVKPIQIFDWTIGGSFGNLSCDSWNDVSFNFMIQGDQIYVDMFIHCSNQWACGNGYFSRKILNTKLAPINKNTGYEARGTFYNDEFKFTIDKQKLTANPLKVKVALRKYDMQNPSNSVFVDIGTVYAYGAQ